MKKRNLTPIVVNAQKDTPAVFLCGARQTGKSTIAKQIAADVTGAAYVTLDDWNILSAAQRNPAGFVAGLPEKVVIDEIQRAPQLLLSIKAEIDRNRKPGRFLLTGSANVLVLPHVSDTLAGRMEILTLWPFSQGELIGTKETFIDDVFSGAVVSKKNFEKVPPEALYRKIVTGGYPEIINREQPARRDAWFDGYIGTITQRDILELAKIEGQRYIPDLLHLLAGRCAGLLSFSDLSRGLQIPQTSLKRYLALLESAFILYRVKSWHGNFNARFIKAPKMYLNDTGLISYLLGVNAARLEKDPTTAGHLVENFVVNELHKQVPISATNPALYHFRSHEGMEVDCIMEDRQGRCVGIEIKASSHISPDDCKGLNYLKEHLGKRFSRGIILYGGTQTIPFDDAIHGIPISSLWKG